MRKSKFLTCRKELGANPGTARSTVPAAATPDRAAALVRLVLNYLMPLALQLDRIHPYVRYGTHPPYKSCRTR